MKKHLYILSILAVVIFSSSVIKRPMMNNFRFESEETDVPYYDSWSWIMDGYNTSYLTFENLADTTITNIANQANYNVTLDRTSSPYAWLYDADSNYIKVYTGDNAYWFQYSDSIPLAEDDFAVIWKGRLVNPSVRNAILHDNVNEHAIEYYNGTAIRYSIGDNIVQITGQSHDNDIHNYAIVLDSGTMYYYIDGNLEGQVSRSMGESAGATYMPYFGSLSKSMYVNFYGICTAKSQSEIQEINTYINGLE